MEVRRRHQVRSTADLGPAALKEILSTVDLPKVTMCAEISGNRNLLAGSETTSGRWDR